MTARMVWWGSYRTTDYAAIDPETTIAVLPVAAIEQHGPHLPVSTDTTIMQGMLETVFPLLPEDLDARFDNFRKWLFIQITEIWLARVELALDTIQTSSQIGGQCQIRIAPG